MVVYNLPDQYPYFYRYQRLIRSIDTTASRPTTKDEVLLALLYRNTNIILSMAVKQVSDPRNIDDTYWDYKGPELAKIVNKGFINTIREVQKTQVDIVVALTVNFLIKFMKYYVMARVGADKTIPEEVFAALSYDKEICDVIDKHYGEHEVKGYFLYPPGKLTDGYILENGVVTKVFKLPFSECLILIYGGVKGTKWEWAKARYN